MLIPRKLKEDHAKYHREVWYPANKLRRKQLNDTWKKNNADKYREWKKLQKCAFCGENDAVCLDLHHLNPSEKEFSIGSLAARVSFSRLERELEKCIVLCANCHRKEHARLNNDEI